MDRHKIKNLVTIVAVVGVAAVIYQSGVLDGRSGRDMSLIPQAHAQTERTADTGRQHTLDEGKAPTFLFVISAKKGTFKNDRIVLHDISHQVVYFSDRPQRIAGNMGIPEFLEMWNSGDDSFMKDPPNAALSIVTRNGIDNPVIEISDPAVEDGHSLSFKVKVLAGEVPQSMGPVSVFVDAVVVHHVGRPLRPVGHTAAVVRRR
jgi:hypothetical protein